MVDSSIVTPFSFILFGVGILVGVYSSVVGGGAIIMVPLFNVLGMPLLGAIATMKACAVVHQGVSLLAFWQTKAIRWRTALWASLWAIPGAFLGSELARSVSSEILSYAVAACLGIVYFATPNLKKERKPKQLRQNWMLVLAAGSLLLSVYGGFYGAGFSTFMMMYFWWLGGTRLINASANASVVCFVAAITSSYFFAGFGLVNWSVFTPVALGGALGAILGVELAQKYGFTWIRNVLHLIIVFSVIKLVIFPG